ncbi:MAG: CRTAC1 family protein [Candidatus Handelsmanbacteria bacterium]|nr:CRTAC1 family protein [Candidatus Handelsmanbacteria bacterium]
MAAFLLLASLLIPGPARALRFVEVAAEAGIDFRYVNGASPQRYLPEAMGSGAALFDADGDGYLDLFIINGTYLDRDPGPDPPLDALYRNRGDGTFENTTAQAGVGDPSYGMGVAAADCDNDGDQDLYLTNFGPNRLYQNQGGGRFADLTGEAGVGDAGWGTGAAFADVDLDGDLDLYVANYLDFSLERNKVCLQAGVPAYCPPTAYPGVSGVYYRNEGEGRFSDQTRQAGLHTTAGRQLAPVFADYDLDGDPDLFVANDKTPNFLFQNQGPGRFTEVGMLAGVAFGNEGAAESAMGADWGDCDNDGRQDLALTTFQWVGLAMYHNDGEDFFTYASYETGVGPPSLPFLGMSANFLDADLDGWLDLFVANGHLDPNVKEYDSAASYAQRNLLFRNKGDGTFAEVGQSAGPGLQVERVSHGTAVGDYDNDGDLDLFVSDSDAPRCTLLRNEGETGNHFLVIELEGRSGNRDGVGAQVRVRAGGLSQVREVRANTGYLSSSDRRVHFGLGTQGRAEEVEIRWPGGGAQVMRDVPADQFLRVREGGS